MQPLSTDADAPPLRTAQRLVYALIALGCSAPHFLLLLYFLKLATDIVRINAAIAGALLASGRVWDAITDVWIGAGSDRGRSRMGRRRPWLIGGGLALGLGVLAIWSTPTFESSTLRAGWLGVALVVYFAAHTAVFVPYGALGVELTRSPSDRNALFAWRHGAMLLAMIAGIGAVAWLTETTDPHGAAAKLGVGFAAIAIASIAPLVLRLREAPVVRPASDTMLSGLRRLLRDRDVRLLLGIAALQNLGTSALSALGPFITAVLLGDESMLPALLGAYVAANLVVTPLVGRVAARVGSRRLWSGAMGLAIVAYVGLGLVQRGSLAQLIVCAIAVGAAEACAGVLDRTMLAAAIDRAAQRTGTRDEGVYVAARTFIEKCAYAIAVLAAGAALSSAGYRPEAASDPAVAIALRVVIAGLPAAAYGLAFIASLRVRES